VETILVINLAVLWIVVLFDLILTLAVVKQVNAIPQPAPGRDFEAEKLQKGEQAPEFTATSLGGEKVSLADYAGQKLVALFVSPTCTPCREKMRLINSSYPGSHNTHEKLIVVSVDEAAATQKFVDELQFDAPVPVLVAPREDNSFADAYKVIGTPWFYIIDEQGKVEAGGPINQHWEALTAQWAAAANSWESHPMVQLSAL